MHDRRLGLQKLVDRSLCCLALALLAGVAAPTQATLLFSDGFAYANGDLAGNGGGTGWQASSLWSGGTGSGGNLVADPLPGTDGKSIQIASNASETSRPLSAAYASGGATTYYISFGFNADPFQGAGVGQYAGVSVYLASPGNNLTMGMPGSSGQFGFDWTNRADLSAPGANNTTYLALYEIAAGTNTGTTKVTMYASTDLLLSGTALMQTAPWVSIDNEANFSFDTVSIAGSYSTGAISLAGLAMADNANEAVAFTQTAVPEPGLLTASAAGLAVTLAFIRRRSSAIEG